MGQKVVKKLSKIDLFRKVGPKTVENFWRPGPVGLGDRRGDRKGGWEGQERAGRGPNWTSISFLGQKPSQKLAIILVTPSTLP